MRDNAPMPIQNSTTDAVLAEPDFSGELSNQLLNWFDQHGRHDLPWQQPRTAYRVWLSEIMLQQTQVATVIPYFQRFVQQFPDVQSLAAAPQDDVLALWAGLGYYARARNLHKAAQLVVRQHSGEFPRVVEELEALPGIGRSTAAAITAQAYGVRAAILDGNVKRVLARMYAVPGWPGESAVAKTLWHHAETLTPDKRLADYTQAIMDLGATVCTRTKPRCLRCPWQSHCVASQAGQPELYPGKKPKKARPQKAVQMLVVLNERGELLLEKRPPTGIWGGLWCLPEAAVSIAPDDAAGQLGLQAEFQRALPTVPHAFSHYDLDIEPKQLTLKSIVAVQEADQRWLPLQQPSQWPGLPAPVKKLLQALRQSEHPAGEN